MLEKIDTEPRIRKGSYLEPGPEDTGSAEKMLRRFFWHRISNVLFAVLILGVVILITATRQVKYVAYFVRHVTRDLVV